MSFNPENILTRNTSIPLIDKKLVGQLNISLGSDKHISLIINDALLLRFSIKKVRLTKKFKALRNKILSNPEKIFTVLKSASLRKILNDETEIREKINDDKKNLTTRNDSDSKDFLDSIEKRSAEILSIQKRFRFDLLSIQDELFCTKCNGFRTGSALITSQSGTQNCSLCSGRLSSKSLTHLPADIFNYIGGSWFEDVIAKCLQNKGWTAWASSTLMVWGVSGAPHQVDVLAIKNGKVVIVECKTGDFSPNHIKNLMAKYYDIRCHHALAISTYDIHPEGKRIIEKNPAIRYHDKIDTAHKLERVLKKYD